MRKAEGVEYFFGRRRKARRKTISVGKRKTRRKFFEKSKSVENNKNDGVSKPGRTKVMSQQALRT